MVGHFRFTICTLALLGLSCLAQPATAEAGPLRKIARGAAAVVKLPVKAAKKLHRAAHRVAGRCSADSCS